VSYQFPAPKTKRAPEQADQRIGRLLSTPDEKLPTIIQGEGVDSKEEARAAIALEILGWSYVFHAKYFGGQRVPGGMVIDLLALTPVAWTPIWVNGLYWHRLRTNTRDIEFFQRSRLARLPNLAQPVEVWDYELQTIDQAVRTLAKYLGRA